MDGDDFWGNPNLGDVSIDTANSEEMMAGSHITDLHTHTHKYEGSLSLELLNKVPNVPQARDLAQKYHLHSSDKSKHSNILSTTNNTTHAKGIDLLNQENQDYYNQHDQQFSACKHDGGQEYYNWRDQQFIACKYDGGLEQVTIELVPDIILEEEEDDFYQWADNYNQWDNTSYKPVEWDETEVSHTFNVGNSAFSTSQKPNETGNWRQELWVKCLN